MGKKKYLRITDTLDRISLYDLEGSLQSAIAYLTDLYERYKNTYNEIHLCIEYYNSDVDQFKLFGTRQETDQERNKRLDFARKERTKRKQRELEADKKTLKTLSEKYPEYFNKEKFNGD